MEEYIEWLESMVKICLEDKEFQRESWAFSKALKKYRDLELRQQVVNNTVQCGCDARCVFNHKKICKKGGWCDEQITR